MSSDMERVTQLIDLRNHRQHKHHCHHRDKIPVDKIGDDECSTDSTSSGSSESGKRLSRRNSCERLCRSNRSRLHYYLQWLRELSTRSQERLGSSVQRSSEHLYSPPEDVRSLPCDGTSPSSYSSSLSDAHSSSDSDSIERFSTKTLRRTFQNLKIIASKKHTKKSPKRILRSPIKYMYVRGPSGLPTQRVPRKPGFQQQMT